MANTIGLRKQMNGTYGHLSSTRMVSHAGVTLAAVGWLLSVNRLVRLPLNVLSGWLADRVGPKTPYVTGIALGVASTAGYGLAHAI